MRLINGEKTEESPEIEFKIFNKGEHLSAIILICYVNAEPKYQTQILAWPTRMLNWRIRTVKKKMVAMIQAEGAFNGSIGKNTS